MARCRRAWKHSGGRLHRTVAEPPRSAHVRDRLDAAALQDHEVAGEQEHELDLALAPFLAERDRLLRLAHRVIGDPASAEDVVQEAWMRWQRTDRSQIKNPAAFLTTTTTNLAINVIQSARHRREAPTDSPLMDRADPSHGPSSSAEQIGAVEETLAHLMARLTRGELAAYLLRKGFDYPYSDIAELLHTSTANSRQLVRRAQPKLHGACHRSVDRELHGELVAAFLCGARTGALQDLERVLVRDLRTPAPAQAA